LRAVFSFLEAAMNSTLPTLEAVMAKLAQIEEVLVSLVREKTIKDFYSTAEVAKLVGKSEYTVREWCRGGRVQATKKAYARGAHPEWLISQAELTRLRNEGLRAG
jgi:transposase